MSFAHLKVDESEGIFANLPKEKWRSTYLYQYENFWYFPPVLKAAIAAKSKVEARDDDIVLASTIKTGTTWMKALIPTIMYLDNEEDPLVKSHPNFLMPSLELELFNENPNADLSGMKSPRLFRTHVSFTTLPESIKSSGCKIVYITRDPKDTAVSMWHFWNANSAPEEDPIEFDKVFEDFCKGTHPFGPFHDHVLGFWKESLKMPEKILFLKYEDLKTNPREEVRKLALFLGKPLDKEEDVDKVLWRCSIDRLKKLEVNNQGKDPRTGVAYNSYFRKGVVGDWKGNLSVEMKERLDKITNLKFEGSGLKLGVE